MAPTPAPPPPLAAAAASSTPTPQVRPSHALHTFDRTHLPPVVKPNQHTISTATPIHPGRHLPSGRSPRLLPPTSRFLRLSTPSLPGGPDHRQHGGPGGRLPGVQGQDNRAQALPSTALPRGAAAGRAAGGQRPHPTGAFGRAAAPAPAAGGVGRGQVPGVVRGHERGGVQHRDVRGDRHEGAGAGAAGPVLGAAGGQDTVRGGPEDRRRFRRPRAGRIIVVCRRCFSLHLVSHTSAVSQRAHDCT
jgi:hypothetical protein